MAWKPLPDDVPLDHEQQQPPASMGGAADPDAALHSAVAGKDAPADMQTDAAGFAPLPEDAQLDGAPAPAGDQMAVDQPGGFSDEQKQAIFQYLPKAKDAADLQKYAEELSGNKIHITNAQNVLDEYHKGARTFGFQNSIGGTPQTPPPQPNDLRSQIGEGIVGAIDSLVPGFSDLMSQAQQSGSGKAFTEHAANALAMDYGPEAGGFIDTLLSPSQYGDFGANMGRNIAHERAQLTGDSEGHPYASTAGEITGAGLATPLIGAAAEGLGAARLAGNAGPAARGFAQSAIEGAAYGSGAAGPDNRGAGAAEGAALAPVVGALIKVPSAIYQAGKSVLSESPSMARRIISRAIEADQNTPASVAGRVAAANSNDVPMTIADTGENVRGLLAAASRASGPARTVARDALENRQAGLADRVTGAIERDLGPVSNPHAVADSLMTQARNEAAPIYEKVYSEAPVSSPAIDALVQRPSMQKALKNAYSLAKEEGRDPEALGLRMTEDGNVQLENGPTLSAAEAKRANPNRFQVPDIPDEMDHLAVRTVTTKTGRKIQFRGPIDMTQRLRMMGGIRDDGGELAHGGISNKPRRMDFGSNEQFLGNLVDNEKGMTLDDATHALWEDGYFPDFHERPTVDDLLQRLKEENMGHARYFDPSDAEEVHNFRQAQSSRFHMEEAAASGRPFAEDQTSPATEADLAARQGPVDEGRRPFVEKAYTPQTLDYIKRGMDDVVESYRDKTTGKLVLDTEGRAVNNTLRSFLGTVDKLYPDYAKARTAYAGPVSGITAMNAGRKALSMTADDLEARMRGMSPFEKQMFALGARRAMAETVATKGDTADVVHALVGTGKKRAMLARLFGDRKAFGRFVDTLGQEREGFRTYKQARLGSPTAANQMDDATLQLATGAADMALTGGIPVTTALRYALKFGVGKIGDKAKQQVAALLSNTDPGRFSELAAQLREESIRRGLFNRKVGIVAGSAGNSAATALPKQQAQ
jgi:hypothetical protein